MVPQVPSLNAVWAEEASTVRHDDISVGYQQNGFAQWYV